MAGGAGASLPFVCGGTGPLFAICGAGPLSLLVGGAGPSLSTVGGVGPSLSTVGGVAGPSSFFMGGGAGCWLHCLWVVVVCPHQFSCGMAPVTVVVVLLSLEGEGGGLFMSVDAPIHRRRCHPTLASCVISMCCHCMSS